VIESCNRVWKSQALFEEVGLYLRRGGAVNDFWTLDQGEKSSRGGRRFANRETGVPGTEKATGVKVTKVNFVSDTSATTPFG